MTTSPPTNRERAKALAARIMKDVITERGASSGRDIVLEGVIEVEVVMLLDTVAREAAGRERAARDQCAALLRRCAIELTYINHGVENCDSGLCATGEGEECIEEAQKLLGPMNAWPEIVAQEDSDEAYRLSARGAEGE